MNNTVVEIPKGALLRWGLGLLGLIAAIYCFHRLDGMKKEQKYVAYYESVINSKSMDSLQGYVADSISFDSVSAFKLNRILASFDTLGTLGHSYNRAELFIKNGDYYQYLSGLSRHNTPTAKAVFFMKEPSEEWAKYIRAIQLGERSPKYFYGLQNRQHSYSWNFIFPIKMDEGKEIFMLITKSTD